MKEVGSFQMACSINEHGQCSNVSRGFGNTTTFTLSTPHELIIFITVTIVMQSSRDSEVNSTQSDDPKKQWDVKRPEIVVGVTDDSRSCEKSTIKSTNENDDYSEGGVIGQLNK